MQTTEGAGPPGIAGPDVYTADAESEDSSFLEITFPTLAGKVQTGPLPIPIQNPPMLPLAELDPEVFERVVAELIARRDNRGVQFYGRRGQPQQGLDIVERNTSGSRSVYQVKRYQTITGAHIRNIVEDYAGPPRPPGLGAAARPFDPQRFVAVVSARVDADTATVDAVVRLQDRYDDDLEIEVWGAEALSRMLRDAPNLVYVVFGAAWAKAFCGFDPAPPSPTAPRPLALVEDPVEVLHLGPMVADAQAIEGPSPAVASVLYGTVAETLTRSNFPGHAALMRRRQASAAQAGGDPNGAFAVLWRLALDRVLMGDDLGRSLASDLDPIVASLGPAARARWSVLTCIADWNEQGTNLTVVLTGLTDVVQSGDPEAALLCCLAVEQAIVDGLFEFDPVHSIFGDYDDDGAAQLRALRALAEGAESADVVTRARLRCAVADAGLRMSSTLAEVEAAYGRLVEDALAGRYLYAGGLVASRAAYQFATHGDSERAENLWRQSVLGSSEAGLYGDVRCALRASQLVQVDGGQLPAIGLDVIVAALPDRRRLLASNHDAALEALEAAHNAKLPDALGDARRSHWEARLAGHLVEETIAVSLLGDVLAAGGHPQEAVKCYVIAGEARNAVQLAERLASPVDVRRWLRSHLRRRVAAAVKVVAVQTSLVRDEDVSGMVRELLSLAAPVWESMRWNPHPEHDALAAVAAFGIRIPPEAVDPILAVTQPARRANTAISDTIADLLVQTYWAVESRREDLADALIDMLRLPGPAHNLWGLVQALGDARQPLLPTVEALAEDGHVHAISVLAAWRHATPPVQLAARRACAALLRKTVGHARNVFTIGTQETATATLLLALLDAQNPVEVEPFQLTPSLSTPAGGVHLFTSTGTQPPSPDTPVPAIPVSLPLAAGAESNVVDAVAILAAGPAPRLLVAVAEQLLSMAEDTHDGGASRLQAVHALQRLIERLPREFAREAATRLLSLHDVPGLSEFDQWEIGMNSPLSRVRVDTGARSLAAHALVTAAMCFHHGRRPTDALSDQERVLADRIVAAATGLFSGDAPQPVAAARAIAEIALSANQLRHLAAGLLYSADDAVRSFGTRCAPLNDFTSPLLATDPSAHVRAALAARGPELPDPIRDLLANDSDLAVRNALLNATASDQ